jgi:hypothetical protein
MLTINYKTPLEILETINLDDEICDAYQVCGKVVEIEKIIKRNNVFFNYVLHNGQNISVIR